MAGVKLDISAGALLIFALAYFFDGSGMLSALLPAAAVHEAGHVAALLACGARIRRLRLDVFGLRLDYSGSLGCAASLFAALAGPAAGLLYAFPAMRAAGQELKMSGAISLLLSGFNLLPALPLDGGRALALLCGSRTVRACSRVTALLLMAAGLWALFAYGSLSMLVMGGWLLVYNAG